MNNRCHLNVTVMDKWWPEQLGLSAESTAQARQARLDEVFPGLLTFPRGAAWPPMATDPNHGFTMACALGASLTPTSLGGYEVVPLSREQLLALEPPDYASNAPVQALRAAILATKAEHGSVTCVSYSGLLYQALKLRGQELFYDFSEEPALVHHLAEVIGETLYRHLVFLKDTCGHLPYFVLGSCQNCMIAPALYEGFFRVHESRISTLSSYLMGHPRAMGIHHCGTKVDDYLDTYRQIEELAMLEADWTSDIARATHTIPGLTFKPMLDPILLDEMSGAAIAAHLTPLLEQEAVEEIQAFGITQHFSVAQMRALLETVVAFNTRQGLPGYTRFML
ncbi:MAG TPA: hypothetical protein VGL77_02880 [Armatimonadota bacterium]|jgi:hypothetical protein